MIPVMSLKNIEDNCRYLYGNDEKRIVGVVIARYDINDVKNMISEQFDFWHAYSGRDFNVFWLGYGAYTSPTRPGQRKVDYITSIPSVIFDVNEFAAGIHLLEKRVHYHYRDGFGIFLCNFHDGEIHFDESMYFDLTRLLGEQSYKYRVLVSDIVFQCTQYDDVTKIAVNLIQKSKYEYGLHTKEITLFGINDVVNELLKNL